MEALTNVAKYASATAAEVTVRQIDGGVVIGVADDGVGGADPTAGSGLAGLADRVVALGGRLEVESPTRRQHPRAGGNARTLGLVRRTTAQLSQLGGPLRRMA